MDFFRDLYWDPALKNHEDVLKKLQNQEKNGDLYVITLCGDPQYGQLQFFHHFFLRQKRIREHCPLIIGLAKGREGAISLVQTIVEDAYRKTGKGNIVAYLSLLDDRIILS